jgi:LysM repeat protein
MRNISCFLPSLVLAVILSSCGSRKPAVTPGVADASAGSYIDKYKELAVSEMKRTGIPASITLAQGMIESDYGRSRLAVQANNHFGIKCHDNWKGPTITHHDDKRNECFRKYRKPEESYYDHSDFLTSASRYKFLFDLDETDYKGWARGLKKAGYATNPDYANMLIRKIEENELWRYDKPGFNSQAPKQKSDTREVVLQDAKQEVQEKASVKPAGDEFKVPSKVSRIKENNRIQYIVASEGDTRESIEKEFSMLKWELSKYNELENDFNVVPGQIIYLQPKRDKAEPGKDIHVTAAGDSMYSISQKYGVKLKKLYEYNRMGEGMEPRAGDKIWLRGMKPVS